MTPRWLVDGQATETVPAGDRGLAYGDGVFETLLVADAEPVWWERHLARLQRGCERLGIAAPIPELLRAEAQELVHDRRRAVLKLIVTRGAGGRGYAAGEAAPMRVLGLHDAPGLRATDYAQGVALRWCETRLALQPRLAGIKHLNRLEQVLARAEWNDAGLAEGLMLDSLGNVVSATAANVFVVHRGRLSTPAVERCGIAGVARGWLLDTVDVAIADLDRSAIESADELFLTSSLRGILPVARLDGRCWTPGPMTRTLQQALWRAVPALRPAGMSA